jgi:ribosomal-protein-alanine N-acetyltransferase
MKRHVVLTTDRLVLRPPELDDAPSIERLAGAYPIALNTLSIPHPYPAGAGEEWVRKNSSHDDDVTFVITARDSGDVVGVIGLMLHRESDSAEIGYWIGVPYWGRGYMTEAARAAIDFGFEALKLNKIYASHFDRNPSSGRVLQKLGMTHEGRLRQHHKKWGVYVDVEMYSLLRSEWQNKH